MATEISAIYGVCEHSSPTGNETGAESHFTIYDDIPIVISGYKLNGNNYLLWSKAMKMFITEKGKEDYLFGTHKPPAIDDPKYKSWKADNNMIITWMVGFMTSDINEDFLFYLTAHEIWTAAKEMYPKKDNTSELYDIKA